MATLKIMYNGTDVTNNNLSSDKKLLALKNCLQKTFDDNKVVFDKFRGEFSIQITGIKILYSYLSEDTNPDLKVPRELIDASISDWQKLKF